MRIKNLLVFLISVELSVTAQAVKVDVSGQLSSDELTCVAARQPAIYEGIKALAGKEPKRVPTISFCFSGGAYRSMISCLGFMLGASQVMFGESSLLMATKYMAGSSGATWFLGNLLLRMQEDGISLEQFRTILKERVTQDFLDTQTFHFTHMFKKMFSDLVDYFEFEPADLWGIILADRLFGDVYNAQNLSFESIRKFLQHDTSMPFPLFALAITDAFPYEWFEVNPFMTGSDYLGCYIPTSAFDSYFKRGSCKKILKERSLGWFLGMFGSAYNFSFGDMLLQSVKDEGRKRLFNLLMKVVSGGDLYEERLLSSPVYNIAFGLRKHPLSLQPKIEISDAGMLCNIPTNCLLRKGRESDIILVCDASSGSREHGYNELQYAKDDAVRKGLKFPPIDHPKKISEYVFVFEDEHDVTVPTIIYFINPVSVSTFMFTYSKQLFDIVCDRMKQLVVDNKNVITDAIIRKVM